MRLISCEDCGVVIDTDRIIKPNIYDHDAQEVIEEQAVWDGDDYVPTINCPICKERIFYDSGDTVG